MARRLSHEKLRIASAIDVGSIVTSRVNGSYWDVGIVVSITEQVGARHLLAVDGHITDAGIEYPYGVFMCVWKFRPLPRCNVTGHCISSVTFSSKTVSR